MRKLMKNPHKVKPQLLASIIASWGYFCVGTARGWGSPGIPSLNSTLRDPNNTLNSSNYFELSESDLSWISSLPPLGALFGSLLISFPMQMFGRRRALIGLSIPYIIGFLLMGFTVFIREKSVLYIGRLLTGLMSGATTPASQIYISECSSPRVRGILGSLTASSLALGILVTYVIGAFVEWHVLCWILGCFPLVLLVGMTFMPETPSWLLAHGREEDAKKSLQRLRGKRTNIETEFQRLKQNQGKSSVNGHQEAVQWNELMKAPVLKPFFIVICIMFFQQFTGINSIVYNTVSIFQSAGSSIEPRYATIIVGFIQLIFTISSGFLVDRFGRRILLLGSGAVVSLSLASLGTFFYFQRQLGEAEATEAIGWLPLLSLMVFFIAYSSGYANVPFIIMGEMFPSRYRNILGPVSSSVNLLTTFTSIRTFSILQSNLGNDGTFWLYMSSTLFSLVFIYFLLPETKGKTLEDIERIFCKSSSEDKKPKSVELDVNGNENPASSNKDVDSGKRAKEEEFVSIQLAEPDDSDIDEDLDSSQSYVAPI